jgi:hypothetical protein
MLRFLCKKCGKRMKVTDDDVGRKIRCPACAYGTAVPPIKLNAKTYHFEYSVCDSMNSGSSPGKNAFGMPGVAEPAGASLGGVTLPPSARNLLAQEPVAPPPSHTLALRPGAKLAPSPKDPARYQAAISRSRARTAALRLRPAMMPVMAPPPQPSQPLQITESEPAPEVQAVETLTLAPPMSAPRPSPAKVEKSSPLVAPVAPPKAAAEPAAIAPAPAAPRSEPLPAAGTPIGPVAPMPTDTIRYEAALQRSRAITARLRPQAPEPIEHSETLSDTQAPVEEPLPELPDRPDAPIPSRPDSPISARPESPAYSSDRPDAPVTSRPDSPIAPRPDAPASSDRPEAPPIRRPDAPTPLKRTAAAHIPRAGMPRPIIVKEVAADTSFVETPDTTPLPVSGRVDPAAQALEQMARQFPSTPPAPPPAPAPSGAPRTAKPSGYSNTHDPAEALRQLAMAASGQPSPDPIVDLGQILGEDDADALTGLARHATPDNRKPNRPTPPKATLNNPPANNPLAPVPSDQERYNAALSPSRDKTRQSSGN